MDKIMKNKRGLELVNSHFLGYKTNSENNVLPDQV